MTEALAIVIAYLLGSIPFGYLAGRLRGIDIRTVGSKSTGATNVFRTLGTRTGVAVMALDIGKGVAAGALARLLTDDPWPLVAAAAAVLGHVYPVWLRFRGGKGVAVGAGVAIALVPLTMAVLAPLWVAVIALTRYVSLGSLICAALFTPMVWLFGGAWPTIVFAGVISLAVIWRHRANIGRLARGTELRIQLRRPRGA